MICFLYERPVKKRRNPWYNDIGSFRREVCGITFYFVTRFPCFSFVLLLASYAFPIFDIFFAYWRTITNKRSLLRFGSNEHGWSDFSGAALAGYSGKGAASVGTPTERRNPATPRKEFLTNSYRLRTNFLHSKMYEYLVIECGHNTHNLIKKPSPSP